MRIPISRKIFFLFFSLTFITIIFGATVYYEVNNLQSINEEILITKNFQLEIKNLEIFQDQTTGSLSPSLKITFTALVDNARNQIKKIYGFQSNLGSELLNRLQTVNRYIDNYETAFFELAQKYEIDDQLKQENISLIESLFRKAENSPLEHQVALNNIARDLSLFSEEFHQHVDIKTISSIKKVQQTMLQRISNEPELLKNIDKIKQNAEARYINSLGINDRNKFLNGTAKLFFEFANDTADFIVLKGKKKLARLTNEIITFILIGVFLTFIFWYISARYFTRFLSDQEYAIESISTSNFNYSCRYAVPNDELGDLTLFMKGLARSLKESKELYKTLVENIDFGIVLINRDFGVVAANRFMGKMFGNKPASYFVGKNCFREFEKREAVCSHCPGQKAMEKGQPQEVVTEGVRDDGSRFQVKVKAFPIMEETGATGFIEVFEDITESLRSEEEKRHLEKQIQHAQKLESLGVLAGGIAHDFNNLLMAILGNADLALLETSQSSPARKNILEIEKASRRAADLCNQMLAYSGKGKFMIQAVNISNVVEEMTKMLEISISKNVVLKYHFAENLPLINADASQLRQIIMNLIINASESIGGKSGVISITTGAMDCDREYLTTTFLDEHLEEGMYVFIEVADTGCGMNKETLASLFDPFFTTKFAGRGLGMSAVLGIVRGHKGGIKVYSEIGQGSTFKLLFPADNSAKIGSEKVEHDKEDAWKETGTVLLVDDDETVRAVGKQMLEKLNFTVLVAENGLKGIEVFSQQPNDIDCVILDLTMPHMNGDETYRELRRIRPDVCAVLSSGYNEQEVTQRFAGKGLAGFIQKPYTLATLKEELQKVFNNKAN